MRIFLITLLMTLATQVGAKEVTAREKLAMTAQLYDCFWLAEILLGNEPQSSDFPIFRDWKLIIKYEIDETLVSDKSIHSISLEAFIDNAKAFFGSQKSYAEVLDTLTNEEQEYLEVKWSQAQFATQRKFEEINSAKHLAVALNDCRERTTNFLNLKFDKKDKGYDDLTLEANPTQEPSQMVEDEGAVAAALAEAIGKTAISEAHFTEVEEETLRVAVQKCWVVDIGSPAAHVTVSIGMQMMPNGKVRPGSLRLVSSQGGTDSATKIAFQAARRAILRCQKGGYAVPESIVNDTELVMTFNPQRMRKR